jgi:hypothetical protein
MLRSLGKDREAQDTDGSLLACFDIDIGDEHLWSIIICLASIILAGS